MKRRPPSGALEGFANDIDPGFGGKEFKANSYILHPTTRGCAMRRDIDSRSKSRSVTIHVCGQTGLSDRLIYLVNIQGNARFKRTAIMENHDLRQGNTILSCSHEF